MPPGLVERVEHGPTLSGKSVARPSELLPDIWLQHAGHLYHGVQSVTIPIPESIIRHPPCGGVTLVQDVRPDRRTGEPVAPVAQRLRAPPEAAARIRLFGGGRVLA